MSIEIATDIMAILGWALFGVIVPSLMCIFSTLNLTISKKIVFISSLSFGLIAASIVLG
jgi:hypothetical protein